MRPGTVSLANRTARAGEWRLASAVATALLQLAIGVLLARLLSPADFGMTGLALITLGLAQSFTNHGVGGAVVQRATLTQRHIRVGFTFSVLFALAMAAAIAAAADTVAVVVRNPSVSPLLRALSLGLPLRAVGVVGEALLRRQLDFKRLFLVDAGSLALGYGVVAVTLASLGFGAWSLVWGSLCQTALASAGQFSVVRHSVRPLIAWHELVDLLRFGLGAAISRTVNFAALQGDKVVAGRWMGAASLGLYERAYALMQLPTTYVAVVMTGVLFPALAQVQDEPARLRRGYLVATQFTALIAAPAMVGIMVSAPYLVPVLYGPKWDGAVVPLQILCAAGYFRALYHLGTAVLQGVGRVYSELLIQVLYACLVIGGSLLAMVFGVAGVAAAVGVAILVMFVATANLALRATQTAWHEYFHAQRVAFVLAAITAIITIPLRKLLETMNAPPFIILLSVIVGSVVPTCVGLAWSISLPGLEPLRARLPGWGVRLIGAIRRPHDPC